MFVSRTGKEDCCIIAFFPAGHPNAWGWRVPGGYERTIARIACESGKVIRHYEGPYPDVTSLRESGYID